MSAEYIANEDMRLKHDADSATLQISSIANSKVKTSNKKTYQTPMYVTISAAKKGTCAGASGLCAVIAKAQNVKSGGQILMRKGDSGITVASGTDTSSGAPCSFAIKVEIDDAGQDKAKAK